MWFIWQAYEREGSAHFNAPRQIGGPGAAACQRGGCPDSSEWSTVAQTAVIGADIPDWTVEAVNTFVDLGGSPVTNEDFHLPNVTVNHATRVITVTTYTQSQWDLLDKEDTGFASTSASELGVKLYSRQCLFINGAGYPNTTSFSVDDPDFCKITNNMAYTWALAQAGAATRARFLRVGEPYVFGADVQKEGGPLWLFAYLQYNTVKDDSGNSSVSIVGVAQKTEIDYWSRHFPFPRPSWIPDPGCYHYCKLLSPARAMEWIYVDSLRLNRHL
jgi:hypothetical protein